jgi:hypothetical protein
MDYRMKAPNANNSILTKSVQDLSSYKGSENTNQALLPQLSKHQMSREILIHSKE